MSHFGDYIFELIYTLKYLKILKASIFMAMVNYFYLRRLKFYFYINICKKYLNKFNQDFNFIELW